MKRALGIAAVIGAALASGCAGGPPAFPDTRDAVVRVVSAPSPDYAGLYVIPDSQVYVRRSGGLASGLAAGVGGAALGVVGGLAAGATVDLVRARNAVGGHEAALAVRFDSLVAQRLRDARVGTASSDSPARVSLYPKALLFAAQDKTTLNCSIEASYSVGGKADAYVHRTYTFTDAQARPMIGSGDGWTDNGGALFRASSQACMLAVADAFAADWHGRLTRSSARQVRVQRGAMKEPRAMVLLHEMGDYVVVAEGSPDSPRTSSVVVLERAALVP